MNLIEKIRNCGKISEIIDTTETIQNENAQNKSPEK